MGREMEERPSDDRKPDHLKLAPPSLKAAVRRARLESAEQSEAVDDLRQAEIVRLELLEEALRPVIAQAPADVEMFDVGIAQGERPRLFLDMISFIDLGHDRRTYRFFQDTRHGRVLIAENANLDRIVAATTNYIARRLVEREQALAADGRNRARSEIQLKTAAKAKQLAERALAPAEAEIVAGASSARERRTLGGAFVELGSFFLMTLGSFTLIGLIFLAAMAAWNSWGRALWVARFGSAPI
jgi:hypothetical protein